MLQGLNDGLPGGRRVDNRMEFFRGFRLRGPRPGGAQFAGEGAFPLAPGEDEGFGMGETAADRLKDEVGRGAETGEAEIPAVGKSGEAERPVADRPRAEKRRRLRIGEDLRDGMGESLRNGHELRVAAVYIPARGAKLRAEVFVSGAAGVADAAGPVNPAHAHAVSRTETPDVRSQAGDATDDLVSWDNGNGGRRRPPFDLVDLRVADAADGHADQDLALTGRRFRRLR